MTTDCIPLQLEFQAEAVGDFEGGRADGGSALLREADLALDLTRRLAACFEDYGSPERVERPRLVAQRLFGIAPGYEDDRGELRDDGPLALAAGCDDLTGERRVRERDRPLAGSGTLNRLGVPEEAETDREDRRRPGADLMTDLFLEPSPPKEIWLDVAAAADPLHGDHALRLRPSNVDGAAGAVEELARIVERIRQRWPKTEARGGSGFCRDDS